MNKKKIIIHVNMLAAFTYLVFFTLRLGIYFKTGLVLSSTVLLKIILISTAAALILICNYLLNKKTINLLYFLQLLIVIPLFLPSRGVMNLGANQNPVYILNLALTFLATIVLFNNLQIISQRDT